LKTNPDRGPREANGYVLPDAKLKQREAAFAIYRDMGSSRSLAALARKLKKDHPEIAVSRQSLEKWSRMHGWAKRIAVHDAAVAPAPPHPSGLKVDPNFDQVGSLLSAANQAIIRAMSATPTVTKPSEVKSLVDAATAALNLADRIKAQHTGRSTQEEIAAFGGKLLDQITLARRKDMGVLARAAAEAACREAGTTNLEPVLKAAAASVGLHVDEEGKIDVGDGEAGLAGPVDDDDVDGDEVVAEIN
jgi:hypothetical protein